MVDSTHETTALRFSTPQWSLTVWEGRSRRGDHPLAAAPGMWQKGEILGDRKLTRKSSEDRKQLLPGGSGGRGTGLVLRVTSRFSQLCGTGLEK